MNRTVLNENFKNWAWSLADGGGIIRSYTLNYDKLFKELFQWSLDTEVFEGAYVGSEFDLQSILKERNRHCHYNLHGSIYWHHRDFSRYELGDWRFKLNKIPYFELSSVEVPQITIDQGRPFVLSNIVAGYRKTQRAKLAPFNQMHSSFDLDCCDADHLYMIGYSFSDEHINSCLRAYMVKESSLRIHIIDPRFEKIEGKEVLEDIIVKHFPQLFEEEGLVNGNHDPKGYPIKYFGDRISIYPVKFEDYLKKCFVE